MSPSRERPVNNDARQFAEVLGPSRSGTISWLVIEADRASGGWFLFGHRSLAESSEFDSWHPTREGALREAERRFGITEDQWRGK